MKRLLTVIVASLVLSGCAATGEAYSSMKAPVEGKAKLYVLRDDRFMGGALAFSVYANDVKVGVIRNNGYFDADIPLGDVEVWGEEESKRGIVIRAEEGKTYCVRVGVEVGLLTSGPSFSEVPRHRCGQALTGKKKSF